MKTVGYARESASCSQERQIELLRDYGEDGVIVIDKRNSTDELMELLKNESMEIESISVVGIELLGRNMEEFGGVLKKLEERSIGIFDVANSEYIRPCEVMRCIGIIARVKMNWTLDKRVYNSIKAQDGAKGGRPRKKEGSDSYRIYSLYSYGEITARRAAKELGISKSTFYRRLQEIN